MNSTATHCDHCGAAVRTAEAAFCEYCGTKLPIREAQPISAAPGSPFGDLSARFAALRADPERERLQAVDVDLSRQALGMGLRVAFMVVFVVVALTIAGGVRSMGQLTGGPGFPGGGAAEGLFSVVPLLIVASGVVMLVVVVRKGARFAAAPLERLDRLWVDERTKLSGGGENSSASTTYFTTLEDEEGGRHEYRVDGKLTGRCRPGDIGVAFIKGDVLVDFRRVNV